MGLLCINVFRDLCPTDTSRTRLSSEAERVESRTSSGWQLAEAKKQTARQHQQAESSTTFIDNTMTSEKSTGNPNNFGALNDMLL
ncbi:hypothetical protein Q1695_014215 [Nippostrongylus brasiliensis]|nr:hypothetical protein Q1695_014215 [Nippostrongylus brasiliensis]